ncbi:MAG: LLM class flavin-dependent oxidoreductase [Rhodospirillales bacterium]
MEFNYFLTSYMPDSAVGGKQHFDNMVELAVAADRLGFKAVSLPEHHLINLLMMPSPLQMAVKIAAVTDRVEIVTAVAVLPVRDMRIFAGELTQADILCDGRLILGVGRGAFAYEIERLGVPMAETRERLDESLAVLQALLDGEDVAWDGNYYRFDPITIMPRPMRPIPMMMAVMNPEGIYQCARRGFNIQTTVLSATNEVLLELVEAFHRGKREAGDAGKNLRLSIQRVLYCAEDAADAREKLELAHAYYSRFDNVFTGPGIVKNGAIEPLPREQTVEELGENLLICPPDEMIDRLRLYADAGIDEVIVSAGTGASHDDSLAAMERFAARVMPHFTDRAASAAAE